RVEHGVLNLFEQLVTVTDVVDVIGNGTNALSLSGRLEDVNRLLTTLTYRSDDDYVGYDWLTPTVNDSASVGLGDPAQVTTAFLLAVHNTNDPPFFVSTPDPLPDTGEEWCNVTGVIMNCSTIAVVDEDTPLLITGLEVHD